MEALLLMFALVAQTTAPLPADVYTQATVELVLRSGPSDSHPGVITVPAGTVLRTSAEGSGNYQPVSLAAGFPIYVHGDFVEVDAQRQTARILGQRVNARLLPSTVGLLPVGRVGKDAGPLLLLGVEGDWVRILAPVELALQAPRASLRAVEASLAAPAWERAWRGREQGRLERVAQARATDPGWLGRHDAELEVRFQQRVDVSTLNDAELSFRIRELGDLGRRLGSEGPAREQWQLLLGAVSREQQRRQDLLRADAAARVAQEIIQQKLSMEAEALALGLSYRGQGQPRRIEGAVSRLTRPGSDAVVFSIRDGLEQFKLSAPAGVADLATLEGHRVILEGRSLQLMNVEGPVLIVDRVVEPGS